MTMGRKMLCQIRFKKQTQVKRNKFNAEFNLRCTNDNQERMENNRVQEI